MHGRVGKDEEKRYDALQYATKSIVASMYGVAGDAKYGMYHPDIASAITFTSRQTLKELKDHAEDMSETPRGRPKIHRVERSTHRAQIKNTNVRPCEVLKYHSHQNTGPYCADILRLLITTIFTCLNVDPRFAR